MRQADSLYKICMDWLILFTGPKINKVLLSRNMLTSIHRRFLVIYHTHQGACTNSAYTMISKRAWAVMAGIRLPEMYFKVPNTTPARNVKRARKPVSTLTITAGERKRKTLYPVCDKAPKRTEKGPFIFRKCSWMNPLNISSSVEPINAAIKAKKRIDRGNNSMPRCLLYSPERMMPRITPEVMRSNSLQAPPCPPEILRKSDTDFRFRAITIPAIVNPPNDISLTGNSL